MSVRQLWLYDGTNDGHQDAIHKFSRHMHRTASCTAPIILCFTSDEHNLWRLYRPSVFIYPIKELPNVLLQVVYRRSICLKKGVDSRVGIICDFSRDNCTNADYRVFWWNVWRDYEFPENDLYLITPVATHYSFWCNLFYPPSPLIVTVRFLHLPESQLTRLANTIKRLQFVRRHAHVRAIYKLMLPIQLPLQRILPQLLTPYVPIINDYLDCDFM